MNSVQRADEVHPLGSTLGNWLLFTLKILSVYCINNYVTEIRLVAVFTLTCSPHVIRFVSGDVPMFAGIL
jgi:hypothetical protein